MKAVDMSLRFFTISKAQQLYDSCQLLNEVSWLKFVNVGTQKMNGFAVISVDSSNPFYRKVLI